MVRTLMIGTLSLAFALAGCSKKDDSKTKTNKKPSTTKKTPDKTTPTDKPTTTAAAGVSEVMKAYEAIRSSLAGDKVDVAAHAKHLAGAAKTATVPDAGKASLSEVQTAATKLSEAPASDAGAVRKAFGEVSRAVVALLTALPDEAKKYHVFECPMAKGYKRWVQADAKLMNPYMGKKMLGCGSEVAFGAKGDHMKGKHMKGDHGMKHK